MVNGLVGVRGPGDLLHNVVDRDHDNVQDSKHTNANQDTETDLVSECFSFCKTVVRTSQDGFFQKRKSSSWRLFEHVKSKSVAKDSQKNNERQEVHENDACVGRGLGPLYRMRSHLCCAFFHTVSGWCSRKVRIVDRGEVI